MKLQIDVCESLAIETFGPLPESLLTPEAEESLFAEWAAQYLFKDKLFFTKGLGWLYFDGIRWAPTDVVVVIEYVRLAIESIRERAIDVRANRPDLAAIAVLARRPRIKTAVDFLAGKLIRDAEIFDADKDIVVTKNCVVDLKTGKQHPHSPKFLVTKVAGAKYVPGMTHPDIEKMFKALESEEVTWLKALLGQGLSGRTTPDDKLVLFHGGGSNGKSVIINSVIKAAGDYAVFLPEKTLMANKSDHATEKMPLRGARLAFIEELPDGGILPVKRLKDLVGTPQMTAREIGKNNVTWDTSHTLFVSTNYLPVVVETDTGTWRRLRVLSFKKRFVPEAKVRLAKDVAGDPTIKTRIPENKIGQLDALLSWMIDGALEFYRAGEVFTFPDPISVVQATEAWRTDFDPILQFFLTQIEVDPKSHVMSTDLLNAFNHELTRAGSRDWSLNKFNKRVMQHEELESFGLAEGTARVRRGVMPPSRPTYATTFLDPVPSQYAAWRGIKFRNHED